jgi:hypothetical protein
MTQDILELAVKHGATELSQKTPRVVYISEAQLESVATDLTEPLEARVAELEEVLTNFIRASLTREYELMSELIELREVMRKAAEQKEGYDLFPVEPSDKMKDAGYAQSNDESKVMCGLIYKAMIAASKEEKR